MNKKAKFKVALKRYLNTRSFYSTVESLTFKNDSYLQNLFSYCPLYGPCIVCVYFGSNSFLCNLYSILKKVFVCGFVIFVFMLLLSCCCIYLYVWYLYDLFHILFLSLQTYGSIVCMYVCMCVCVCVCVCVCTTDYPSNFHGELNVRVQVYN
jgi:hypothetical protein